MMNDDSIKRVAIYIRVSTDEQVEEGYSISTQTDRLTSFCQSQGWIIHDYYTEDGKSAKNLERPELKRMLSEAEEQKFDIVLVYKLDRLTRSVSDLHYLLNVFEQTSVKFRSATEVYDTTTAMGRLFITLVAALAQWERENIAERVRVNMEQMVTEGKRPGAPIPYGYDNNEIPIDEEKKILRELRRLFYEDHLGYRAVARNLNARNMLKRETEWSAYSVWYCLDNPYYAGIIRWGGKKPNGKYATRKKEERVECIIADGSHEAIYTKEEYEDHTKEMKNRQFTGHSKKQEYWFSRVLRCGRCGSAMTGRFKKNKHSTTVFYICAKRQQGQNCNMPMFKQELVEQLLMVHIASIHIDNDEINNIHNQNEHEQNIILEEINELKKQHKKIRERKKKWQLAYADDLITATDLKERTKDDTETEEIINRQIEHLNHQLLQQSLIHESLNSILALPDIWSILDDYDKNQLIRTIFKSIVVDTPVEKAVARKGHFIPATVKSIEYN